MKNLDYYGNVRELSNLCEKLMVLGRTDTIDEEVVKKIISIEGYEYEKKKPAEISGEIKKPYKADDVPEIGGGRPGGEEGLLRQNRLNREIIEDALRETRYNRVKAAEYLGISRSSLYNYIRKLGIKL